MKKYLLIMFLGAFLSINNSFAYIASDSDNSTKSNSSSKSSAGFNAELSLGYSIKLLNFANSYDETYSTRLINKKNKKNHKAIKLKDVKKITKENNFFLMPKVMVGFNGGSVNVLHYGVGANIGYRYSKFAIYGSVDYLMLHYSFKDNGQNYSGATSAPRFGGGIMFFITEKINLSTGIYTMNFKANGYNHTINSAMIGLGYVF
jgi:hypothetical protein